MAIGWWPSRRLRRLAPQKGSNDTMTVRTIDVEITETNTRKATIQVPTHFDLNNDDHITALQQAADDYSSEIDSGSSYEYSEGKPSSRPDGRLADDDI